MINKIIYPVILLMVATISVYSQKIVKAVPSPNDEVVIFLLHTNDFGECYIEPLTIYKNKIFRTPPPMIPMPNGEEERFTPEGIEFAREYLQKGFGYFAVNSGVSEKIIVINETLSLKMTSEDYGWFRPITAGIEYLKKLKEEQKLFTNSLSLVKKQFDKVKLTTKDENILLSQFSKRYKDENGVNSNEKIILNTVNAISPTSSKKSLIIVAEFSVEQKSINVKKDYSVIFEGSSGNFKITYLRSLWTCFESSGDYWNEGEIFVSAGDLDFDGSIELVMGVGSGYAIFKKIDGTWKSVYMILYGS